jgi:hypothetical protein
MVDPNWTNRAFLALMNVGRKHAPFARGIGGIDPIRSIDIPDCSPESCPWGGHAMAYDQVTAAENI